MAAALSWLLGASSSMAQCISPNAPLGNVRVQGKTLFAGLVDFGRTHKICMGIEIDSDELLRSPVDLEVPNAKGSTVAHLVIEAHPRYSVAADGLILIRPRKRAASWLDFRIHRFNIPRTTVQDASNVLYMFLHGQIEPRGGYAGHFPVMDNTDLVGPFDEKERTVRELLNRIVTSSKGAIWVTTAPYDKTTPSAPGRFWTILEYSDRKLKEPVV